MSPVRPRGATATRPVWRGPPVGLVRRPLPGASPRVDPRLRRGAGRPLGQAPRVSGVLAFIISQLSWVAVLAVIGCHLALAADEAPLVERVTCAVPALILIVEARAYLSKENNELPFILFAMLQFYLFFGFPVLVETSFFDLTGPVLFTEAMRNTAGLAVALGALSLWAGGRAGFRLGHRFAPFAERAMPPEAPSDHWDLAFYIFAGVTILVTLVSTFAPGLIPGQIEQAVGVTFQLEFAIGLAIVRGPRSLGRRSGEALLVFGTLVGMARGMINPIARSGMAYVAGRWVTMRRLPIVTIVAMGALFAVLQPAKHAYRAQIWSEEAHTGQATNLSERVTAWQNVFTNAPSQQHDTHGQPEESNLARLCELDPLIHAMQVVPQHVPFIYGKSLLEVVYAPIPRLIWPNKPTTIDSITQRYAVIFGIQTERGAQSTAIGMNMLVEGFWNFGWFGIPLLCFAAGLVAGASQSIFSGEHWALCAIGIAQISTLNIPSTVVLTYSSLFQFAVGRLIAVWGVYWLARLLSSRTQGVRGVVTQRLARR